jgi:integrase/recombinase XerC
MMAIRKEKIQDQVSMIPSLVPEVILNGFLQGFLEVQSIGRKKLYINLINEFFLFHGKEIDWLSIEDCQSFFLYLDRVQSFTRTSKKTLQSKKNMITKFIYYLNQINFINFNIEFEKKQVRLERRNKKEKEEIVLPRVLIPFIDYLKENNYQWPLKYKKQFLLFWRFLDEKGENIDYFYEENHEIQLFTNIHEYEDLLSKRVTREEIQKGSATIYLRCVQLFVKFLYSQGLVTKQYNIPVNLRGRSIRSNEYVPKDRIIELMNAIYETSKHIFRDLVIFLIIVDTGGRSVEVSNITMDDVDLIEKTISLQCPKSDRRKIKISPEVMEVIKDYLAIRDRYLPKSNAFLVNVSGEPITTSLINNIFYKANVYAFNEARYSARSFRHTYISNALKEYKFEKVSKAVGHKEWRSTYYYLHRSKGILLKNTLDFQPLKKG